MAQYQIVDTFQGYRAKKDVSKLPPGVLISGSRNVVSTDGDTVASRQGYTLLGQVNTALNAISASFEWDKLRLGQIALRAYDTNLEFFDDTALGGDNTWQSVETGLANANLQFTTIYDSSEQQDVLLFVNGTGNVFMWSGGVARFGSATTNTITISGTSTWAERGFLISGTRQVTIGGTTYTYTGGESTTTLTGVTPDPTLAGHTAGDTAVQAVRTTSNIPTSTFNADLIATLDNQVYYGSTNSREVYVSRNTDYTNISFSSPRLPGEGALLTFDDKPNGFIVDNTREDRFMYVSAGSRNWYQIKFQSSADLTNETLVVTPLKSSAGQAAVSQSAISTIKNSIVFISQEPTLDFLGRVEDINTSQALPISDPIKTDFDGYTFTGADIEYYRNNVYVALPAESLLLIYNLERGYWEPPWDVPAGRLAVINDTLCLHSNAVPETYQLFQGYSDRVSTADGLTGNPINAVARFSYMNYGDRVNLKNHIGAYAEGYITRNTSLTQTVLYDLDGASGTQATTIDTSSESNLFISSISIGLGQNALGQNPVGSTSETVTDFFKFRLVKKNVKVNFFEHAFQFSTNAVDQRWEILSFGCDVTASSNKPISISK